MDYSQLTFPQQMEWLWNCATSYDCLMYYWFRVLLIILLLIILLIIIFTKTPVILLSNWHHFYSDYQFSGEEFAQNVEAKLKELQLPNVHYDTESLLEAHLFSARRKYLTVRRKDFVFFISSAHLGTGSYVSWWMSQQIEGPLNKIPFVSKWLLGRNRKRKTMYQLDAEAMFKTAVHTAVQEVLEDMTAYKTQRPITDADRQYKDIA